MRMLSWNPTLTHRTREDGAPVVRSCSTCSKVNGGGQDCPPYTGYCLILGFTAEYSKSVRKFTAT